MNKLIEKASEALKELGAKKTLKVHGNEYRVLRVDRLYLEVAGRYGLKKVLYMNAEVVGVPDAKAFELWDGPGGESEYFTLLGGETFDCTKLSLKLNRAFPGNESDEV